MHHERFLQELRAEVHKFALQNKKSFILALLTLIMYWLSIYLKYRFI